MTDTKIIKKLEMSITPDTKLLKVSVYINNESLDNSLTKDSKGYAKASIKIYTQDSTDTFIKEFTTEEISNILNEDIKISQEFTEESLGCDVLNNMFFVDITVTLIQRNHETGETFTRKGQIKGTVLYPTNLYKKMINVLREEQQNKRDIPKHFIDNYLRYKGLQLSLLTGNKEDAIKYFKFLMR